MTSLLHSVLTRTSARLRDESGAAMIIAIITLLVTTALAGVAVTVATHTNSFARKDVNRKNALEAAEAGLQVALYRLNMLQPSDSNCVGDAVAAPNSSSGNQCQSSTFTLGNGSSYQYYTTPKLAAGSTCVGNTLTDQVGITNRCITAVGTSGGVTERSQIRAAAFSAEPLFPVAGITGLNWINDNNNDYIGGGEASNGSIAAANNVTITGGIELGPIGSFTNTGLSNPPQTRLTQPLVLAPVNPGNSATVNSNANLTTGADPNSGVSYNASTRSITTTNSHPTWTITGGIYNFCNITVLNNMTINLAPGVSVEIFIDSPDDPGSGCPAGSGTLDIANNVTWNTLSTNPNNLQIYVYGTNDGNNVVTMSNNNVCVCDLYAPQSKVLLSHSSNNSGLTGAVSAAEVNVSNNFNFTYDGNAGTLVATTEGLFYRTAWAQCSPTFATSSPGSGCG
jgi:Tfp pilus assembly protein PilX